MCTNFDLFFAGPDMTLIHLLAAAIFCLVLVPLTLLGQVPCIWLEAMLLLLVPGFSALVLDVSCQMER